jgi:hypothetical protein
MNKATRNWISGGVHVGHTVGLLGGGCIYIFSSLLVLVGIINCYQQL